jgi:hypothetical protein
LAGCVTTAATSKALRGCLEASSSERRTQAAGSGVPRKTRRCFLCRGGEPGGGGGGGGDEAAAAAAEERARGRGSDAAPLVGAVRAALVVAARPPRGRSKGALGGLLLAQASHKWPLAASVALRRSI